MSKIDPILRESHMEKTMSEYRNEALRNLSSVITHPNLLEDFALLMAHAWMESQPNSINLADRLDLGKIDFLAILQDLEAFKEVYLWQQEEVYIEDLEDRFFG